MSSNRPYLRVVLAVVAVTMGTVFAISKAFTIKLQALRAVAVTMFT